MASISFPASDIESKQNKVSSISADGSDEQYPNVPAVIQYVGEELKNAEKTRNKTSEINEYSTDNQYPSAAAVVKYVKGKLDNSETEKDYENNFANALKGTKSGNAVFVEDVSPVEHDVKLRLMSDSMTDFSDVSVVVFPRQASIDEFKEGETIIETNLHMDLAAEDRDRWDHIVYENGNEEYILKAPYTSEISGVFETDTPISCGFIVFRRTDFSDFSKVILEGNVEAREPYYDSAGSMEYRYLPVNNFTIGLAESSCTYINGEYTIPENVDDYSVYDPNYPDYYSFPRFEINEFRIKLVAADNDIPADATIYTSDADGIVEGVKSISPSMAIITSYYDDVVIEMEYNRDINKLETGGAYGNSIKNIYDVGENSISQKTDGDSFEFWSETTEYSETEPKVFTDSNRLGAFAATFGGKSAATGKRALAEGTTTWAEGSYSHAEGNNSCSRGANSHAEGKHTLAKGENSHTEGYATLAENNDSHAEGFGTTTRGKAAHAEGMGSLANGEASHAEGNGTFANSGASHSEGSGTHAEGSASHAEGDKTYVYSEGGHAEGILCQSGNANDSSVTATHAEGYDTKATGQASHAEGHNTKATGDYSHAEGRDTEATKLATHAEGFNSKATNEYAHAEGVNNTASGKASHVGGEESEAFGRSSFAHGLNVKAKSNFSAGFGEGIETARGHQFIVGRFNKVDSELLFAVGDGDGDSNRKNTFEVLKDGRAVIQKAPINDMDVANKKYVDEAVAANNSGSMSPLFVGVDENGLSTHAPAEMLEYVQNGGCVYFDNIALSLINESCAEFQYITDEGFVGLNEILSDKTIINHEFLALRYDQEGVQLHNAKMYGKLNMQSHNINNVAEPIEDGDAANKAYVDSAIAAAIKAALEGN